MEEEQVETREYDWGLMKRLLVYLKPYRIRIIFALLLLCATALLQTYTPFLVKNAIDGPIANHDLGGLNKIALIFFFVLVAQMLVNYGQVFIMQMTGQHIMYDMRVQIFSHIQRLEMNFFHKNPVGRLMTRVTNDVDVLNELFTSGVVSILGDILTLLGIVIAMLYVNPAVALVSLSVLPMLFIVTALFRKKARSAYSETRYWLAKMNAFLQEAISGMGVIQIFTKEKKMFNKFDNINHKHYLATKKSISAYAVCSYIVRPSSGSVDATRQRSFTMSAKSSVSDSRSSQSCTPSFQMRNRSAIASRPSTSRSPGGTSPRRRPSLANVAAIPAKSLRENASRNLLATSCA